MTSDTEGTYNNVYIISGNQPNPATFNPSTIYGYNTIIFSLSVESGTTNIIYQNYDILRKLYSSSSRKKTEARIKKYINTL